MKEHFDIFIPAHPKDFHKLKFLFRSIQKNLTGWKDIHLSTPERARKKLESIMPRIATEHSVFLHSDEDLIDFDPARCAHRPNWIQQQYLKMFQGVTSDLYLTIDADVIFLKPLPMFTEGSDVTVDESNNTAETIQENELHISVKTPVQKRILWQGWEQNFMAYFVFQERMLNLPREFDGTGICDMNFMDRKIIREMLEKNGYDTQSFIEKSYEVIGPDCYPAEPEIFIQYVMKYHPDLYIPMQARTKAIGKDMTHLPADSQVWTDEEIEALIAEHEKTDLQMIMTHSWYGYQT